jgi:hypothetical protein
MSTHRRKDASVSLSQRELDILKVLTPVLEGKRTQAEAARLLGLTARHIRRLLDKLRSVGAPALGHYTVRFENRIYQVERPIYPGLCQGRVVIELRLDGTMAIRFKDKYLNYREVNAAPQPLGGSAPRPPGV